MHIYKKYFKGERKKFKKNCQLNSYAIAFGQRLPFLSKNLFSEKNVSFIYFIITLFIDRILFKNTQSSIKIDVIVVKNMFY